jgi:hypothetical protein
MTSLSLRSTPLVIVALLTASSAFPDLGSGRLSDWSFAITALTQPLDPPGSRTQHYGPYASGSPDSGTCGNDWADNTFDRVFMVKKNPDGSFTVIQHFKNGTFVTNAGLSPGACDTDEPENLGGLVAAGVTGGMNGYFIIEIPSPLIQTSTDPHCDAVTMSNTLCTTATFINTHFAPCYPVTCPVTTFFFRYNAGDQQLEEHEWKNASDDRGGTHGDIRSN